MSKYIKLEDAIKTVEQVQGIICGSTLFADLPTIEVSEDAISRARAKMYCADLRLSESISEEEEQLIWEFLDGCSSVIPSRPQGEWIDTDMTAYGAKIYKCSNCHTVFDEINPARYHYCPQCGADMRGNKK